METQETQESTQETENQELAGETEANVLNKNQEQTTTYTQSDLDKIVTKALDTRERKLNDERLVERKKLETEQLKEKEKYQELYERSELERKANELKTKTDIYLRDNNLSELSDIFALDNSTLDGRIEIANKINKLVVGLAAKKTDEEIDERLQTSAPAKTPAKKTDLLNQDPQGLNLDELKALKAQMGMDTYTNFGRI